MNRQTFDRLEEHFRAFIEPLLDKNDAEDISLAWEIQKFLHTKKMRLLTAESQGIKKWKQSLFSR